MGDPRLADLEARIRAARRRHGLEEWPRQRIVLKINTVRFQVALDQAAREIDRFVVAIGKATVENNGWVTLGKRK